MWALVAPLFQPLEEPQVAVLPDGRVLVAGGATNGEPDGNQALRATELYDVARDAWTSGSDLLEPRYGGHALVLADGSVLVLGGANDFNTEGEAPWCPTPLVTTERLGGRRRGADAREGRRGPIERPRSGCILGHN